MKVIFLIFLLLSTIFADNWQKKSSIFDMIITNLIIKKNIKVYLHTHIESIEHFPHDLIIVKNCEDADIVILSTLNNVPKSCENKILFGTKYSHLQDKKVIGAFFWQKGRPNILLYRHRLEKNNIKMSTNFDKYIENE